MFNKEKVDKIAMELLHGKGYNRASFARLVLEKEEITPKDKNETRELFDNVLKEIQKEHGNNIYKDGHDYFIKELDAEALKAQVEELKKEKSELAKNLASAERRVPGSKEERKQWLYDYKKIGKLFYISEVKDALLDGWKEHPEDK